MRLPRHPTAPLAGLALAAALAGCSAFGGDDYGDLAPGTFRFSADGETYTGAATFYPNTDRSFDDANLVLAAGDQAAMSFRTDDLLDASAGDKVVTLASLQRSGRSNYRSSRGIVRVESADGEHIEGRFRIRLEEGGVGGPLPAGDITAEGGFHAVLAEE